MTLRPPPLQRHIRIPSAWRRPPQPPPHSLPRRAAFHTTPRLTDDTPSKTHYETLSLPSTASPTEIKKSFFALSKRYHPDHNRHDPDASTKFVQISEAYHTLSVPDKRAKYDRELAAAHSRHGGGGGSAWGVPTGSHSSHQAGYAGSRSPSGLNRRRTTFRGPPPSFYKSGGYGNHGAKRTEHAHQNQSAEGRGSSAAEDSHGAFGGFGPGQTSQGNEVPHFDDQRHRTTHESVHHHIHMRRRARHGSTVKEELGDSGMILNFALVGGTLGIIVWIVAWLNGDKRKGKKDAA